MLRYVTTRHYNNKLSVNNIIIIIEIIITIIINNLFHLFICLCGVFMVSPGRVAQSVARYTH